MELYQQRVIEEKKELDGKREMLAVFLKSEAFLNLDYQSATYLKRQSQIMKEYSDVLGLRIASFKA